MKKALAGEPVWAKVSCSPPYPSPYLKAKTLSLPSIGFNIEFLIGSKYDPPTYPL
jgi:hypothetical protein